MIFTININFNHNVQVISAHQEKTSFYFSIQQGKIKDEKRPFFIFDFSRILAVQVKSASRKKPLEFRGLLPGGRGALYAEMKSLV
jgi:hypothetical protein